MTFDIGLITIYDDAVSIHDPVVLSKAKAVKLAWNKGVFWDLMSAPNQAVINKVFEVYGRNKTAQIGTTGNWADGVDTTALAMTAAAVNVLQVGSVIKVESEVVVVKSVDRTGNTIDVFERGAGSTTGVAHNAKAFTVIGLAGNDTDLKNVESFSEKTNKYTNYVQTIFETIDYTFSDQLIGRKGLSVENHRALHQQESLFRVAEHSASMCLNGIKALGTKAIPYQGAGLYEQLQDDAGATRVLNNFAAGAVAFSEPVLKSALEQAFQTGSPNTLLMNQKYKNILDGFNDSLNTNVSLHDKVAGREINAYNFQGKHLSALVDADCQDGVLAVLTKESCKKSWQEGDSLKFVDEPKASSREVRGSLQGSIAFSIEGVGHDHLLITGLN